MPDIKFSNKYPYTDFHELNLDWIIKEVKFWSERVGKSIQKIELTGTVGLVDTYTITYSDGSTSTFDVTNGNGITSVAKTGTVGLVDTYTITFQDGSTTTFEVHNGTASIDDTLTKSGWAADAEATGQKISETINDNDILSGRRHINLYFNHGWINGSGVYDPTDSRYISQGIPVSGTQVVTNASGAAVYIIYFSSFTDFSTYTYARYAQVDSGHEIYIDKQYPYFCVESNQTAEAPLANIKLFSLDFNYISEDENAKLKTGDYTDLLTNGGNVSLGNLNIGDTVDLSTISSGSGHYTALIPNVIPGEQFTIYAVDGAVSRPYAFMDEDYHLLEMATSAYAENIVITAPANTRFLLVQVGSPHISNAYITRHDSFDYILNGNKIGINDLNDPVVITDLLENANNVASGDTSTPIKNRPNIISFIHFSDVHGKVDNINRILDFNLRYSKYISSVIHSGDSVVTYFEDDNPFANVSGDQVLNVIGNHDCWHYGSTWPTPYDATSAEVYAKFISPFISNWSVTAAGPNLCYYYKDYPVNKFRIIVLDAIHWDSAQLSWFTGILNDAISNSLAVIAIEHYPAQSGLTKINCSFNEMNLSIDPVTPGINQMERLPDDAFVAVDNFINNGGEFVCWLSGHSHGDYIGTVNNHSDQIQILVSCALTSNSYSECARTPGTKTQDLFNVFTADQSAKLIKITRIGADTDRFMRSRKTLCVNYSTKTVISNN